MESINEILDAKMVEHHAATNEKRTYLGASSMGEPCLRKIQLQYTGHGEDAAPGVLRTFAIGHALEPLVAEWMRIAGFQLKTHDENGEQFGFSVADGRIGGHIDGILLDGPDGVHYPCLWECKTMNDKNWNHTVKHGVPVSKPHYYVQVQLYMAHMKLDKNPCVFTALNKNTSELYVELIPFDAEAARLAIFRAASVVRATARGELLPCISLDPSFHKCKICSYREFCTNRKGGR
jgi:CRISPR/Cas system-associated exonuclease Cas4 (RecB family)